MSEDRSLRNRRLTAMPFPPATTKVLIELRNLFKETDLLDERHFVILFEIDTTELKVASLKWCVKGEDGGDSDYEIAFYGVMPRKFICFYIDPKQFRNKIQTQGVIENLWKIHGHELRSLDVLYFSRIDKKKKLVLQKESIQQELEENKKESEEKESEKNEGQEKVQPIIGKTYEVSPTEPTWPEIRE